MIFNTHSHINDSLDKAKELIDKCNELNVTHIAVIGYDINSSLNALKLAKEYPNIHAVCGIQPEEIDTFDDNYDPLIKMWKDKDCVAIGEIGLDYYWTKENKERQKEIFEKQIQYAISLNKPIAIHCRDAHQDTYDILSKYSDKLVGIIMHCYSGSTEMMERYLKLGAYISFAGVVTFKNAKEVKENATVCPLDRILVETDDPYLTPVPFRGQTNEPSNVIYVVQEIAKLKGLTYDEVAKATFENAKKVYNI